MVSDSKLESELLVFSPTKVIKSLSLIMDTYALSTASHTLRMNL
jgi:hypothetical protein